MTPPPSSPPDDTSAKGAGCVLVFCMCPQREKAEEMARHLVEARLAACVNVLPGARSFFCWQGALEEAEEALLLIKSTEAAWPALRDAVREAHEYELPEIIAVPIVEGLPGYLRWVADSVGKS